MNHPVSSRERPRLDPDALLPATLVARYLFFLSRRPVSASNPHFRGKRLAGLQALARSLQGKGDEGFEEILRDAAALTPTNLYRAAPFIEEQLLRYVRREIPRDVVISAGAPQALLAAAREVLLVCGPGIGIGDEIICFRLACWIRHLAPDARITVLSWYEGLWDRRQNIHTIRVCADFPTMLDMLRSAAFDTVLFADFEDPGLTPAMARESQTRTYVELSLGARSLTVFDASRRWLYRRRSLPEYFSNFYRCLDELGEWIGVPPSPSSLLDQPAEPVILVSPFTSKEDPSEVYWSRLIAALAPHQRGLRFLIDSGPNSHTESFASSVAKAVRALAPHPVDCEVVRSTGRATISLRDVLEQVERCAAVITADSYLAHAAPSSGRPALVLAREGLENWRAPAEGSFYFNPANPLGEISDAMRAVLSVSIPGFDNGPTFTRSLECRRLSDAEDNLRRHLDQASPQLGTAWNRWSECCHQVLNAIREWPPFAASLLADQDYRASVVSWPASDQATLSQDLLRHLRSQFQAWEASNLSKFLRRVSQ